LISYLPPALLINKPKKIKIRDILLKPTSYLFAPDSNVFPYFLKRFVLAVAIDLLLVLRAPFEQPSTEFGG
jgi:hypothetical protein